MDAPGATPRRAFTPRRLLLLLACLSCVVSAFSARDLWAPDEPRYGQVAREMLEDGHWLVPHVNGEPYPEKPPLWYWAVASVSAIDGTVTAASARVTSALLAAGAVLLTFLLGRRLFRDEELATTAALLFSTFALVLWNAPRAALDMPLTFFCLLAIERGLAWRDTGQWTAALLAGAAWAGAILVKGPIGAFLPPLVLGVAFVAARRAPSLRNVGWWLMPLVCVGLCLAWLLPALEAGGQAYADRLLGQIAERATGAEKSHQRGPLYYLLRIVPFALPWTLHLLAGLGALLRRRRFAAEDRAGLVTAGIGSVGLLLLLTAFGTKREVYMVPALPFAAMLSAYAIHHHIWRRLQGLGRLLAAGTLVVLGLAMAAAPFLVSLYGEREGMPQLVSERLFPAFACVAAGLGVLLGSLFVFRALRRPLVAVRAAAFVLLLGASCAHLLVLPLADPIKSSATCARAAEEAAEGGPILLGGWDQGATLLWNLPARSKPVRYLREARLLPSLLAEDAPRVAVVAETKWWDAAREQEAGLGDLSRVSVTWRGKVGNRRLVVLTNPRPSED